jgi:hypothetical protein
MAAIFSTLRIQAHFPASGGRGQAKIVRLAFSGGHGLGE